MRIFSFLIVMVVSLTVVAAPAGAAIHPDLQVSALKLNTTTTERSGTISAKVTIRNGGWASAGRNRVGLFLSLNKSKSGNDLALSAQWRAASLGARGTSWRSWAPTVPAAAISNAYYYVIACADVRKVVREMREGNNCRTSTRRVHILTPPTLSIDDVAIVEGDVGNATLIFHVTQSRVAAAATTVQFQTSDGTGGELNDYGEAHGSRAIAAGSTQALISVPIVGDTDDEDNESFTVTLSSPTNSSILDATGAGTITDDDLLEAVSATATSPTTVDVQFNGAVSAGSIDATDFVIDNGLVVMSATLAIDPTIVTVTSTLAQSTGTAYTITVSTLLDTFGGGVDPSANSGGFTGF